VTKKGAQPRTQFSTVGAIPWAWAAELSRLPRFREILSFKVVKTDKGVMTTKKKRIGNSTF